MPDIQRDLEKRLAVRVPCRGNAKVKANAPSAGVQAFPSELCSKPRAEVSPAPSATAETCGNLLEGILKAGIQEPEGTMGVQVNGERLIASVVGWNKLGFLTGNSARPNQDQQRQN